MVQIIEDLHQQRHRKMSQAKGRPLLACPNLARADKGRPLLACPKLARAGKGRPLLALASLTKEDVLLVNILL